MLDRLIGLQCLSDDVAWQLVELQYRQRTPTVIGMIASIAFCAVAFVGTGSLWYLPAAVCSVGAFAWRFTQLVAFARKPEVATAAAWARRSVYSAAATGSSWALLSLTVALESDHALIAIFLGLHAGLMTGGAVRNSPIRLAAIVQLVIGGASLLLACSFTKSSYLHFYACLVVIHFFASFSMCKSLHQQFVRTLISERDARELASELARANQVLAHTNDHLQGEVAIDPLTGLLNRRAFDLAATREWRAAAREQLPVALLMIDVDYFKRFNDCYGHQAGDECLRIVASILAGAAQRPADIVARFGGEEFIAVFPGTIATDAAAIGEQVLAAIATRAILHDASPFGYVSMSIGVAATEQVRGTSLQALIGAADGALYEAKREGRNRVRLCARALTGNRIAADELA